MIYHNVQQVTPDKPIRKLPARPNSNSISSRVPVSIFLTKKMRKNSFDEIESANLKFHDATKLYQYVSDNCNKLYYLNQVREHLGNNR